MTAEELYKNIGANYAEAKSRLMSDKLITKFIVKFLSDPSYDQLMAAWDVQNEEAIFRTSHTLKGVCANLALTNLFTLANDITEAYRPGQEATRDGKNIPLKIAELKEQYTQTTEIIRAFAAEK